MILHAVTDDAWEYKTVKIVKGRGGTRELNRRAAEGWEVVSTSSRLDAYQDVVLRRHAKPKAPPKTYSKGQTQAFWVILACGIVLIALIIALS